MDRRTREAPVRFSACCTATKFPLPARPALASVCSCSPRAGQATVHIHGMARTESFEEFENVWSFAVAVDD